MKLEGVHRFDASREPVWTVLTRPESLAKTIPGVERLDVHDADHWTVHVALRLGLVRLRMAVECRLVERREPEFARLEARGEGAGGSLRMDTRFELREAGAGTEMGWAADLELGGRGAAIGNRFLHPLVERQVGKLLQTLDAQACAETT